MTIKCFVDKFRSRYLWIHLGLMAAFVVAIVVATAVGTDIYTRHGEKIVVPDLRNKNIDNVMQSMEELGLTIEVTDTSYNRNLPADCILQQIPAPGEKVKWGRIIYVTINSANKPTLVVPDIIDNASAREATAMLRILGFKVGEPIYVNGEKGWVYGVICHGKTLSKGDKVSIDDMVYLQVGDGKLSEDASLEVTDPDYSTEDFDVDATGGTDPFEEVE